MWNLFRRSRDKPSTEHDPSSIDPSPELELTKADVDRLRRLASQDPDTHLPDLAEALGALGSHLIEQRPLEALQPAQEALQIYRRLADQEPEKYRRGLAFKIDFVSTVLMMLGRCSESLKLKEQTASMFRELAQEGPWLLQQYVYVLAGWTHLLRACGRNAEAVDVAFRRVEICRTMIGESGDLNLVQSLEMLCGALAADGQVHECLQTAREALTVQARRFAKDPEEQTVEEAAMGIAQNLALLGRFEALGVLRLVGEIQQSDRRSWPFREQLTYWRKQVRREATVSVLVLDGIRARALWALADGGGWDRIVATSAWIPPVRWTDRWLRRYLNARPRDPYQLACREGGQPAGS